MKLFKQAPLRLQESMGSISQLEGLNLVAPQETDTHPEKDSDRSFLKKIAGKPRLFRLYYTILTIGAIPGMDAHEKRKLGIFNKLNFFQIITGISIPIAGFFHPNEFPNWVWVVASLPALVSIAVLWLNALHKYQVAIPVYFICYPVLCSVVYLCGINMGMELLFIFIGVLSLFYIQDLYLMLFSVSLSMISFFMLSVLWIEHRYQLESTNFTLYLLNEFLGILFIFYGLFLLKKENNTYQERVLQKNREIAEKANLLKHQTAELSELNTVKDKLFSIIAHDLKTPMYALRNLFRNIQEQKLPAKEIKSMLPDVINDLNYTTGLMENLLQWAKSQMQSESIKPQILDIGSMTAQVIQLLQLQADAKQINIQSNIDATAIVKADKDMINLVLRNLLSNAIKFTATKGSIEIGINDLNDCVEVFIKDNGQGISPESLRALSHNNYFTTYGTAKEPGTGLGLMLCKEFLLKNGGQLFIESEPGSGSTFSFTLPRPE
jgi:signal transduction histidine kinase